MMCASVAALCLVMLATCAFAGEPQTTLDMLARHVVPLSGADTDYDPLLGQVGDARFVLLGESTHGSREPYQARIEISKRLIAEKGFSVILTETNWPEAYYVDRYIRGTLDITPREALSATQLYPSWFSRNQEMLAFVRWLREHNATATRKVRYFGMDIFDVKGSAEEVVKALDRRDSALAREARGHYGCLLGHDSLFAYGKAVNQDPMASCAQAAESVLHRIEDKAVAWRGDPDYLNLVQSARAVIAGEHYHRLLFEEHSLDIGWNVREQHMLDTIQEIIAQAPEAPKIIIWAHNLHVGDARANEIGKRGNVSLGQLIRQRYPEQSVAVGFSTYSGEVVASDGWGQEPKKKTVLPARKGSYEDLFHQIRVPRFLLMIRGSAEVERLLNETEREQRNIGVVYTPEDEDGHYYKARLADQFDAVVHFDKTSALEIF